MATLVLTVIGDDQSGLVDALSGVITDHGGNWDTSRMARLAGKFAGIVMVTVPDAGVAGLVDDLGPLETQGLLEITVEEGTDAEAPDDARTLAMEIFGVDHPGIVHEVSHALAQRGISIDELNTETRSAPMAGGTVFEARATLRIPAQVTLGDLEADMERLAGALAVDIELTAAENDA